MTARNDRPSTRRAAWRRIPLAITMAAAIAAALLPAALTAAHSAVPDRELVAAPRAEPKPVTRRPGRVELDPVEPHAAPDPRGGIYPSPLPDFAHPGSPHASNMTPASGDRDRPVLVLYSRFSDVTNPPGEDAAFYADQIFGADFPSLADYYRDGSFGRQILTPAAETQGTDNDGIVEIAFGTKATWNGLENPDRNKRALRLADSSVDFSVFDDDGNGKLSNLELVVVHIREQFTDDGPCHAANRGVASGYDPDDVTIDELGIGMTTTGLNLITTIHESYHTLHSPRDLYGTGIGSLDIAGPTCSGNEFFFDYMGVQKLHIGWIKPTIVTRDGFYLVSNARTSGRGYLLYDPDRGTEDYFLVENRQRTPGTYDQDVSDSGLVIWRVDDENWNPPAGDSSRWAEIMRPDGTQTPAACSPGCYGGSDIDAWDPSDPDTPETTLARTWQDGTASRMAVRAIGPSGSSIRAYFDVRGPGVLVDPRSTTFDPYSQQWPFALRKATPVSFRVRNTGEATGQFRFTLAGLPAGWSATTDTRTLGPNGFATVTVQLTPGRDVIPGRAYAIQVSGQSTSDASVQSSHPLTLRAATEFFECPTGAGPTTEEGCLAHSSMAEADFDGDGFADLAIGVPDEDVVVGLANVVDAGAVNVVYGSPTGLSTAAGNQLFTQVGLPQPGGGPQARDRFGAALAAGDFDLDGYDDLAIGVPGEDIESPAPEILPRPDVGVVHILYGSKNGLITTGAQAWWQDSANVEGQAESYDHFGSALVAANLGFTGASDLAIGVPDEDLPTTSGNVLDAGTVNVLFGSTSGLASANDALVSQGQNGIVETAEGGDRFGSALAAGDTDANGFADLVIGVPYEDVTVFCGTECFQTFRDAGVVQVVKGTSTGLRTSDDQLWSQQSSVGGVPILDQPEAKDLFGAAVALGRFGSGTTSDLAIGVPGEDSGAGVVQVLYGSASGIVATGNQLWSQGSGGLEGTHEAGDGMGFSLAAGDLNANGVDDLVIGAPWEDIATTSGNVLDAGLVHVLYGTSTGIGAAGDQFWYPGFGGLAGAVEAGSLYGHSVSVHDFGNGTQRDIAIGIPKANVTVSSTTAVDAGAVQVLHGSASGVTGTGAQRWFQGSGSLAGGAEQGDHLGMAL